MFTQNEINSYVDNILNSTEDLRSILKEDFTSEIVNVRSQGGTIFYPNEEKVVKTIKFVLDETIFGNIYAITEDKETEVDNCMFRDITIAPIPSEKAKFDALSSQNKQVLTSILSNLITEKVNLPKHIEIKMENNTLKIRFSIL